MCLPWGKGGDKLRPYMENGIEFGYNRGLRVEPAMTERWEGRGGIKLIKQ